MKLVCNLVILLVGTFGFGSGNSSPAEFDPADTDADADILQLSLEKIDESAFSSGQVHTYSVELSPGDYLLSVDQGGLDLRINLTGPVSATVDSPTFRDDRETVLLHADRQVQYEIKIDSDEYTGASGRYSIVVEKLEDGKAAAAYRLMTEAAVANGLGGNDNWRNALQAYESALSIWERLGNTEEQARTLYSIAFLQYWQLSSWIDAVESAASATVLYGAVNKPGLRANAMHLQAASLIEAASEVRSSAQSEASAEDADVIFRRALSLFQAASDAQAALNNNYDKAQTTNNIGLLHLYRDDLISARQFFVQAAQEFRRLNEWSGELNPLANLAVIDHEKGRLVSAVASYKRLLELIPADREVAWRADTLDNLATAQLLLGDSDSALQNYFAARKLHEGLESIKGEGRSVAGIGSTYLAIGEVELARDYVERALELRREAHDGKGQVADLRVLADIHRILGQVDVSLKYHGEALELATTPLVKARVQVQQASDWIETGNYARAADALISARDAAETGGAIRVAADAAYESGRLSLRNGDKPKAESWLNKAHDLYAGIGLRSGQAQSLLALARLKTTDDIDTSIAYAFEAVGLIEDLRSQVADLELRAVYLGRRADYYEFLIHVLMQASNSAATETAANDYVRRALEVSERARARATVDLINEAAIDFAQSVDPEILARQATLDEQLIAKAYQRDRLLKDNATPDEIQDVVAELQTIRTELDVLEAEARNSSSLYADLNDPAVIAVDEIQALLDADTAVLQYALGEVSSYLWIITQEDIRPVAIPSRSVVRDLARGVYAKLAAPNVQTSVIQKRQADIMKLSAMIIAPAKKELLEKSRVVVAADDALHYLPFSVLSLDGESALNDSHEIVVIPSLTVVAAHRDALLGRESPEMTIAVIGDPVFDDNDPRLVSQLDKNGSSVRSTPQGVSNTSSSNLARLPFSGQEIDRIAALVDESDRMVATGFDASKERVVGDQLENFRYVHFATHGLIDSSQPALSTLAFSMRDTQGAPLDGYLRLRDIYNLRINADLVVLSACDTALGREIRGEGLMGLTQGFLYAGASRVAASLWRVPDKATAELMTRFYKGLLDDHLDPVAALRAAQRDMAQTKRWRDPYYWSGFVIQGDWN